MNGFTFLPALGWVAGGLLAAGLAVLGHSHEIALFVRRRASSDETVCFAYDVRLCRSSSLVMVLTPSVVSSTTSRVINTTTPLWRWIPPGRWRWPTPHTGREDHYPHRCRTPGVCMM